jgi:hypothetical protein
LKKHPEHQRRIVARSALALVVLSCALVARHASADWPPPEDATAADMADPMNWPNDPDYAWSADSNGQWNYYSFMVDNANVRPEEKATGMSTDLAWRLTTGDPRVIIAVTDSGIKWDEDDIIEAAFINHKELANHRPLHGDGSACGDLDPTFYPGQAPADLAGFDCNADGIVTVADFKDTPSLVPAADAGHPLGDKNQNGKLDAGDLILNFSDGVDDDQNGYVDDISGWDFMKDDNDPYDDTRYGHGTGEARDSMSRANNGIGSAGGCNQCRFLPMRVGDSFITDVNDFGQAVLYATDMHVKIVQSALGTVNMSAFAQRSLDYAWDHGVITVASMADENSRHHNMPTASNHTLPVHAIEYAGEKITEARTFLQYHPCSNFGGQNFLSAAGTGCSSEATGQTSGIVGLVWSAGIKYGVDLTPGEVFQLMIEGADDIDVPESQKPGSTDRWSQPGFDQRFGYGRVNANNAVEAVRDGRIPPVVDIVTPRWFSVLYKDQVTGPVDIVGTISAKRATSFDYTVEWAPGVQPLDGEFKVLKTETGLPPETVVGGGTDKVGEIDIRNLDGFPIAQEKWDADSPNGENQHTLTVRIRAVAHYGGTVGDVKGENRRTYYVHSDPDLVKGFPMFLGGSGEASPKMADIDGDGVRDLVYGTSDGELHVFKLTGSEPEELDGFPFHTRRLDGLNTTPSDPGEPTYLEAPAYKTEIDPDSVHEALTTSAPAIADFDGDGKNEIVAMTYPGTLYVIGNDGAVKAGWPKQLPRVPSCSLDPTKPDAGPCMSTTSRISRGAFAAPVVADMDKDGKLDIIQAAFDGKIYVFHADGSFVDGFPVDVGFDFPFGGDAPPNRVFTTPAVADFNGDGFPDLVVGSNQRVGEGGNSGAAFLVDGRGTNAPSLYLPHWPITMTSLNLFPLVAEGITNSPVAGTIDGTLVAVVHGNASSPLLLPADPGEQTKLNSYPPNIKPQRTDQTFNGLDPSSQFGPLSKTPQPNTMLPLFSQPALGDMDQDGVKDVIASGGSLDLAISIQSPTDNVRGGNLLAMWSAKTGHMLPASPMTLEDFTFFNSSAIADLSNDGYPEAIIGSGGYYLHAYDGCGREPEGWPKFTGQWIIPTPAIGDVDGDGNLEVAVGTRSGWLYLWHTAAPTTNVIEWESYHHDNHNTGNIDLALDQGGPTTVTTPLTEETCAEPVTPTDDGGVTASGGCSCDVPGNARTGVGGAAAMIAAVALGMARRRAAQRRKAARGQSPETERARFLSP